MPENNVIALDPLGQRYTAACEARIAGELGWVEASIEMAVILIQARESKDDRSFGAWLRENERGDLDPNERSCLINLGRDPALMRQVLNETDRRSYRYIWDDAQIRYSDITIPNREPATDTSSNVRSTSHGPYDNVVDADLTELFHQHGNSHVTLAPLLTANHPEVLARSNRTSYTPQMIQNRLRTLGLITRPPRPSTGGRGRGRAAAAPQPQRSRPRVAVGGDQPNAVPLTREQMDPTWTEADGHWIDRHGHVNQVTAEQRATGLFHSMTTELRAAVRAIRETPDQLPGRARHTFDAYWLRHLTRVNPRDVARLTEAIEYLRPRLAEAEAALAHALLNTSRDLSVNAEQRCVGDGDVGTEPADLIIP